MDALAIAPPDLAVHRPAFQPFAALAPDLEQVERVLGRTLSSDTPAVAKLLNHLHAYRGKRLRPLLLLLAARACGKVTPTHHTLAAVVELIHTATLVHDDVLDDADTRRHAPTAKALWGNQSSILLGDLLFTRAYHLAATTGDAKYCELIGAATNAVCEGELLQAANRGNFELTEAEYFASLDGKTAALTAVACRLGALAAGAPPALASQLADYGRRLGLAFQVADDLLDLAGDERRAGKTLGTDLAQGKLTLPLLVMLRELPAKQAAQARELLRAGEPNCRAKLQPLLAATDALDVARRRADGLAAEARAALGGLPASESQALLARLTEWAVRREA